jgi:hypothetical protein
MVTAPCRNSRIIILFLELFDRHLYRLTHASACSEGVIQYSLCQRGIHSFRSAPQLHLVSDAMTGALCAVVCEVSAVTHCQRRRMVELIDRVRLYHQFLNLNDGDCFVVRYSSTCSINFSILFFCFLPYSIHQDAY